MAEEDLSGCKLNGSVCAGLRVLKLLALKLWTECLPFVVRQAPILANAAGGRGAARS